MKWIAIVLMLAFPASASAEAMAPPLKVPEWTRMELQKPKLKFQKKKLWNLAALPAYFFLETTLHEGSHGVAALACGAKVTAFKPYPHMADGHLLWGAVYTDGKLSRGNDAVFTIAPYMTDIILFTSVDLLLGYRVIPPGSVAGLIVYIAGMLAPWINFVYNANNPRSISDFSQFSKITGMNRWALLALSDAIAAFAAWRLWVRGREVLFSAVPAKSSRFSLAPFASGDAKGVAALVRF